MIGNYLRAARSVFMRRRFMTFVNLFGITFTLVILFMLVALLDHVFGNASPEANQNRTLGLYRANLVREDDAGGVAALPGYGLLDRYGRDLPAVEAFSISTLFRRAISYVEGRRIESYIKYTDAAFWDVLSFEFIEGKPFSRGEVRDSLRYAVINEATRERFFGSNTALGKPITIDTEVFVVMGVVRNVSMLRIVPFADVWLPITTLRDYYRPDELAGLNFGLILARSPQDFDIIRRAFSARIASADMSGNAPYDKVIAVPETKFDTMARLVFTQGKSVASKTPHLILMIVLSGIVFMILPSINLINLNVSRILERSDEIGVRKAFGASSASLVLQFLFENLLLSIIGGIVALCISLLVLQGISDMGIIPYAEFQFNYRILLYMILITVTFGLLSGLYPAWRMAHMEPIDALRGRVT